MENEPTNNPIPEPTSLTPTPVDVPTPPPLKTATMIPTPVSPTPKNWLPLIIGGAIVLLLLILIIGISVGLALIKSAFQYTPPPIVTQAPVITIAPVSSKYATDSGVLKLRDDLKTISQSIDSVDLFEPQINPPALDLSISIKTTQ